MARSQRVSMPLFVLVQPSHFQQDFALPNTQFQYQRSVLVSLNKTLMLHSDCNRVHIGKQIWITDTHSPMPALPVLRYM